MMNSAERESRAFARRFTATTRRRITIGIAIFVLILAGWFFITHLSKGKGKDHFFLRNSGITDTCANDKLVFHEKKNCFSEWLSLGDESHVRAPWRTELEESYGKAGMFFGDFRHPTTHQTIWVASQGRSGSSVVRIMLHMLGVPFGIPESMRKNNTFESMGLKNMCRSELMLPDPSGLDEDHSRIQENDLAKINAAHPRGIANIKKMIERQNEEMDVWGSKEIYKPWECLMAGDPPIYKSLRNMKVIFLTRDLSGMLDRHMRLDTKGPTAAIGAIKPNSFTMELDYVVDREARLVELLRWLKRVKIPTYSIGFSRIVKAPQDFLEDLEVFVGRKFSSYCKPLQIIEGGGYTHLCGKDDVFADLIKKRRKSGKTKPHKGQHKE